MLSRQRRVQLAAVAALTVLFGANAAMSTANAQTRVQLAQAEKKQDVKKSSSKQNVKKSSSKQSVKKSSSKKVVVKKTTNRTVVRSGHNNTKRTVVVRDSRPSSSVAFVVLGPRVVYRSYGSGWCRALHNGRHWAPRIGWHRGRHVGAVRCG